MYNLLYPYFLLVVLYVITMRIYTTGPYEKSIRSAVLKCLPMLYLIGIVATSKAVSTEHEHLKNYMVAGLVASVCGDFFLTWLKEMFLPGVLCFGAAHVLYVMALGFQPYGWNAAPVFLIFGLVVAIYITTGVKTPKDAILDLKPLVSAYIFIIHVMGWRSYVYYQSHPDQKGAVFIFIGALTVMLSDFLLALNMFKIRFSHGFLCVELTYYLGQFLIALSVIVPSKAVYRAPIQFYGV